MGKATDELWQGTSAAGYHEAVKPMKLSWQSKLVQLVVYPAVTGSVALELPLALATHPWTAGMATLGCALLGLAVWRLHAATAWGAAGGAAIAAAMLFGTAQEPARFAQSAVTPLILMILLTGIATRMGRGVKQRLGTAEARTGRNASQVGANLGVAALAAAPVMQAVVLGTNLPGGKALLLLSALLLAALGEATADTLASELGQIFNHKPRLITNLREVEAGTDGAISLPGTLSGVAGAALVVLAGTASLGGGWALAGIALTGSVAGLFIDSLLGATLERRGWVNNDAVNFLSTVAAGGVAALLAVAL